MYNRIWNNRIVYALCLIGYMSTITKVCQNCHRSNMLSARYDTCYQLLDIIYRQDSYLTQEFWRQSWKIYKLFIFINFKSIMKQSALSFVKFDLGVSEFDNSIFVKWLTEYEKMTEPQRQNWANWMHFIFFNLKSLIIISLIIIYP